MCITVNSEAQWFDAKQSNSKHHIKKKNTEIFFSWAHQNKANKIGTRNKKNQTVCCEWFSWCLDDLWDAAVGSGDNIHHLMVWVWCCHFRSMEDSHFAVYFKWEIVDFLQLNRAMNSNISSNSPHFVDGNEMRFPTTTKSDWIFVDKSSKLMDLFIIIIIIISQLTEKRLSWHSVQHENCSQVFCMQIFQLTCYSDDLPWIITRPISTLPRQHIEFSSAFTNFM